MNKENKKEIKTEQNEMHNKQLHHTLLHAVSKQYHWFDQLNLTCQLFHMQTERL